MMILVNIFAIVSAALFFFRKISPLAFLISSSLWFVLMVIFWYLLPRMIYKSAATFKDTLRVTLGDAEFIIENNKGSQRWAWKDFSSTMESPHFFHLYFDTRSFFLVPKSGCKDIDEVVELRKLIQSKVKKG